VEETERVFFCCCAGAEAEAMHVVVQNLRPLARTSPPRSSGSEWRRPVNPESKKTQIVHHVPHVLALCFFFKKGLKGPTLIKAKTYWDTSFYMVH
jgi:hypothetical protein